MPTLAFAAESEYVDSTAGVVGANESTEDSSINVNVSVRSKYSVKIPKTVILDGQSGIGEYLVSVSGDIAGDESIAVIPESSVTMHQEGKTDVVASIDQIKVDWRYDEFETIGQGLIRADLPAGCWNGSFDFNIEIDKDKTIIVSRDNIVDSVQIFSGTVDDIDYVEIKLFQNN